MNNQYINQQQKLRWSEYHQAFGVFRAWRRNPKTKEKMWAKKYGKRAWFIPVAELEKESE